MSNISRVLVLCELALFSFLSCALLYICRPKKLTSPLVTADLGSRCSVGGNIKSLGNGTGIVAVCVFFGSFSLGSYSALLWAFLVLAIWEFGRMGLLSRSTNFVRHYYGIHKDKHSKNGIPAWRPDIVEDDACNISSLVHDDLSPSNAMSGAPHIHNDTQGAEGCSEMEATSEEWKRNDTHANNTPDHRTAASTLLGNIATLEHAEPAPGSYRVQQQGNSTAGITNRDIETLKGTQHINDCIATALLRTICLDYPDVHIASSHFLEKLRITDWSQAKTFFRNRIDEANGNLSNRQLRQASLDAPVLIFPVHGSLHWNALIRDSRGVGLEKARWRYFDTKFTVERLKWVKDTITNSPLWKEGMTWETVVTPQQVNDDCGPLMGAIAVGFVRWSACVTNRKYLNSNDLQVRNKMNPIRLGKAARTFARQAIRQGRLPMAEVNELPRSYRFKIKARRQNKAPEQVQAWISTTTTEPSLKLPPTVCKKTRPNGPDPFAEQH